MPQEDFTAAFDAFRVILGGYTDRLTVGINNPNEFLLVTAFASPFPQHKGQPLHFACVRRGKTYVSLHLLLLYMNPMLRKNMSADLKRRMQGKTCFNFKSAPEPELFKELKVLTEATFLCLAKLK